MFQSCNTQTNLRGVCWYICGVSFSSLHAKISRLLHSRLTEDCIHNYLKAAARKIQISPPKLHFAFMLVDYNFHPLKLLILRLSFCDNHFFLSGIKTKRKQALQNELHGQSFYSSSSALNTGLVVEASIRSIDLKFSFL